MHNDFLQFIMTPMSEDYWSDEAIMHAISLIRSFSSKDWRDLSDKWISLSPATQVRVASVAEFGDKAKAESLLINMLQYAEESVVARAAHSLINLGVAGPQLDSAVKARLQQMCTSSLDQMNQMSIMQLLK